MANTFWKDVLLGLQVKEHTHEHYDSKRFHYNQNEIVTASDVM